MHVSPPRTDAELAVTFRRVTEKLRLRRGAGERLVSLLRKSAAMEDEAGAVRRRRTAELLAAAHERAEEAEAQSDRLRAELARVGEDLAAVHAAAAEQASVAGSQLAELRGRLLTAERRLRESERRRREETAVAERRAAAAEQEATRAELSAATARAPQHSPADELSPVRVRAELPHARIEALQREVREGERERQRLAAKLRDSERRAEEQKQWKEEAVEHSNARKEAAEKRRQEILAEKNQIAGEADALKAESGELRLEVDCIRAELNEALSLAAKRLSALECAQQELHAAQREAADTGALRETVESLEAGLREEERKAEEHRAASVAASISAADARREAEGAAAQSRRDSVSRSAAESARDREAVRATGLEQQLRRAEASLLEFRKSRAAAEQRATHASDVLRQELAELRSKVCAAESADAASAQSVSVLRADNVSLKQEVAGLRDDRTALRRRLTECDALKARATAAEADRAALKRVRAELEEASSERDSLEQGLAVATAAAEDARLRILADRVVMEELRERCSEAEMRLVEKERELCGRSPSPLGSPLRGERTGGHRPALQSPARSAGDRWAEERAALLAEIEHLRARLPPAQEADDEAPAALRALRDEEEARLLSSAQACREALSANAATVGRLKEVAVLLRDSASAAEVTAARRAGGRRQTRRQHRTILTCLTDETYLLETLADAAADSAAWASQRVEESLRYGSNFSSHLLRCPGAVDDPITRCLVAAHRGQWCAGLMGLRDDVCRETELLEGALESACQWLDADLSCGDAVERLSAVAGAVNGAQAKSLLRGRREAADVLSSRAAARSSAAGRWPPNLAERPTRQELPKPRQAKRARGDARRHSLSEFTDSDGAFADCIAEEVLVRLDACDVSTASSAA